MLAVTRQFALGLILAIAGTSLITPPPAAALCCDFFAEGKCNVFGCNCDAPCANFAYSKTRPVVITGSDTPYCGVVPGILTSVSSNWKSCSFQSTSKDQEPQEFDEVDGAVRLEKTAQLEELDTDDSGSISFSEASAWAVANKVELDGRALKEALDQIDTNGDGTIQATEFDKDLAGER